MRREQLEHPAPLPCNALVSGGSTDSVLTSAEVLRHLTGPTEIVVTRANAIAQTSVASWPKGTAVTLVGLAVDRRKDDPTLRFLKSLRAGGHRLISVVDEHDRRAWKVVLEAVGISLEDLVVQPESQEHRVFLSAGSVLLRALGDSVDLHGRALLQAADAGDARAFYENGLTYCTNAVLKAAPSNHGRKVRLMRWLTSSSLVVPLNASAGGQGTIARFLANAQDPQDVEVLRWAQEYAALEAEHERLLREAKDEGDGVFSFCVVDLVDMTVLTQAFYNAGARVVFFEDTFFRSENEPGVRCVGIGTDDRNLRIGIALEAAGLPVTKSTRRKTRVSLEDAPRALAAIKEHLREVGPICRLPSVAVGVSPQGDPEAADGQGGASPVPHSAGFGGSSRGLTGRPTAERSVIPPEGGTKQAQRAWRGGFRRTAGLQGMAEATFTPDRSPRS